MEKNKSIWVMYERSDIDQGNEYEFQNYQSNSWAFTDFETARKAMRNRIAELSAGENALFDEPGEMPDLKKYVKEMIDSVLIDEGDEERADALREFYKTLRTFLTDPGFPKAKEDLNACLELFHVETIDTDFEKEGWQDGWSIGFGITNAEQPELICRYLGAEAVMNCITPYIYINCFIMNDPDRKYSFHIQNGFKDLDYTSSVFLELEKVDY